MEWTFALAMIGGGMAMAIAFLVYAAVSGERRSTRLASRQKEAIASNLLYAVLRVGGVEEKEAGIAVISHVAAGTSEFEDIDLANWAEAFAARSTMAEREALVESAVRLSMKFHSTLPLLQYTALIELIFALGLHIDSLARLRERYGFAYTDFAKDRLAGAGRRPFFSGGETGRRDEHLRVLGLSPSASRREVVAAFRRLVVETHPDRFYSAPEEERARAESRLREVVEAYESLLPLYRSS